MELKKQILSMLLLVLGMLHLVAVSDATYISQPKYGLLMEHVGTLDINEQYYYVNIEIRWPQSLKIKETKRCEDRSKTNQDICDFINQMATKMDNDVIKLDNENIEAINKLKDVLPEFNQVETRQRRGLLNVVGELGSFLFGLVNERQFKLLAKHVGSLEAGLLDTSDQITRVQQGLSQFSNLTTKRLDELAKNIALNQNQTNQYLKHLMTIYNYNLAQSKNQWNTLNFKLELLSVSMYSIMDSLFYHSELLTSAGDIHNSWVDSIEQLLEGRLPFGLVPPNKLKSILDRISNDLMEIESQYPLELTHKDLAYYYHSGKVVAGTSKKGLYLRLSVPVHSPNSLFDLYYVNIYPVMLPNKRSAVKIDHENSYFAISRDRTLYMDFNEDDLNRCNNDHPRKCHGALEPFPIQKDSCMANIFLDHQDANKFCPLNISVMYNQTFVRKINSFLLVSDPEDRIHLYCGSKIVTVCKICLLQFPCSCTLSMDNKAMPEAGVMCTLDVPEPTIHESYSAPFVYHFSEMNGFTPGLNLTMNDLKLLPPLPNFTNFENEDAEFSKSMHDTLDYIAKNNNWMPKRYDSMNEEMSTTTIIIEVTQGLVMVILIVAIVVLVKVYLRQRKMILKLGKLVVEAEQGEKDRGKETFST